MQMRVPGKVQIIPGCKFTALINPMHDYRALTKMDEPEDYLLKHAHNYPTGKDQPCAGLSGEDVLIIEWFLIDDLWL